MLTPALRRVDRRRGWAGALVAAAKPGARTFLSAAALEANQRAGSTGRRPEVAADRNVRAPAAGGQQGRFAHAKISENCYGTFASLCYIAAL
jgi:hypothetical protein